MTTAVSDISGCVLVPIERLRRLEELEALESELPTIIAKEREDAVRLYKKEALDRLNSKAKVDPKAEAARKLKKYYENREQINARRREQYKLKREKSTAESAPKA